MCKCVKKRMFSGKSNFRRYKSKEEASASAVFSIPLFTAVFSGLVCAAMPMVIIGIFAEFGSLLIISMTSVPETMGIS